MEDTTKGHIENILSIVTYIKDNAVAKEAFDKEIGSIKEDIHGLKPDIRSIKYTMVTKDYLDEKMADQRGDLTVLMRKEDTKLRAFVDILHKKQVLDNQDVAKIGSMEPIPTLSLS